jgi:hypothetical protein
MPFSLDTDTCLQKIHERGNHINWPLLSELKEQFHEGHLLDEAQYDVDTITGLFDTCSLGNLCPDALIRTNLIRYLSSLVVLTSNDISGINVSVLLSSLKPRQICNLYRHLYIEWQSASIYFKQLGGELFSFVHTPRDFNKMSTDAMLSTWHDFVHVFVRQGKSYALFFVNHLHSYMLPFE